MSKIDSFLQYLSSSDRFIIVPMRDFNKTNSKDKVVISFRHDMDDNLAANLQVAKMEHKYKIKATYFFLHSANYYSITKYEYYKRTKKAVDYLKTIQNNYGHEIGFHNDLVTLQVVFNIKPTQFLQNELKFLKENGINIYGTTGHGSPLCYIYRYTNYYFWEGYKAGPDDFFYNWEYVPKDDTIIKIEKAKVLDYFEYNGNQIHPDYFFHDVGDEKGIQWHMGMTNFDTIRPGKKVVILIHPERWYP